MKTLLLSYLPCFLILSGLVHGRIPESPTLFQRVPFYHSTEEIRKELSQLSTDCPHLSTTKHTIGNDLGEIDVVSIKKGQATNRFFLLAGEHARELISPESALHFVRVLCGQDETMRSKAEAVLKHTEFMIIVNGNPLSRKKVEQGDYCLRVNENGVDLNRNWGDHWESGLQGRGQGGGDTNPGTRPFSEPEVQIFKSVLTKFNPHVFLTVHSGTLGMYMPYAYSSKLPPRNEEGMLKVLRSVDDQHCRCPFGPAGKEVGYESHGTCLDYAYDKLKVPFSYAFEIYTDKNRQEVLHSAWEQALRSSTEVLFSSFTTPFESDFAQSKDRTQRKFRSQNAILSDLITEECLTQFNPMEKEEFDESLLNWTSAYLQLASETARELSKSESG